MKNIFLTILTFVTLNCLGQQNIITNQVTGTSVIYGLSTDTKPSNPLTDNYFVEINTGNIYYASGGVWMLPTKQKTIKSLSDFPTPVSNVITLPDSVSYLINGTVDIGVNRFSCGVKNSFIGQDRVNDKLISTTTGTMFTMDGTTTTKSNILFSNLTIGAANGTILVIAQVLTLFIVPKVPVVVMVKSIIPTA